MAQRAEGEGWGSWGGDSQPLPTNYRGLRECCKLPQRGPGGAPAAEGFSCILSRQKIAFPSISVGLYMLHTVCMARLGIRFF